jgi:GDPmannose 4,6-dehydratase
VRAMWLMLQQETPDDYVVATGRSTTIGEFCRMAFACAGLDWQEFVRTSAGLLRPAEVDMLRGDAGKARRVLGWQPKVTLEELVAEMVEADLARHRKR